MTTFEPTRPRRPVYASYTNPGPYHKLNPLLGEKGHDSNSLYPKKPGYYFGLRTHDQTYSETPGPHYMLDNPQVYRDGLRKTPMYSILGRKDMNVGDKTPSPGDYDVIKCTLSGAVYPKEPRCIFGKERVKMKIDPNPAPNSYTLPPVFTRTVDGSKKQSPIYSMRPTFLVGHPLTNLPETPGPAAYKPTELEKYTKSSPKYTMRPMTQKKEDVGIPGPGAHKSEAIWDSKKKKAPAYTFGIQHSQYIIQLLDNFADC